MGLSPGTRLGPYEITAPLGAGGMGEVYRARDTRLDRTVAIKVVSPRLVDNPEAKLRFKHEARAISQLQHPHICVLHDVGSDNGSDFLVMEYLEGHTLADRLVRGPIPLSEALKIAIEITDALDRAHRAGVLHRDLKPGNIMLTRSGAKLMDFGLAKSVTASAMGAAAAGSGPRVDGAITPNTPTMTLAALSPATSSTQQGSVVGTFLYMPPEVLQGAEADTRSDIFSLGCVIYEMVAGRPAFQGKTQASVVASILALEPPPISELQPMLPAALGRVVSAMLAKDPEERIQSAHDLKLPFELIAQGSVTAPEEPTASPNRERMLWAGAMGATLIALVATGIYLSSASGILRLKSRTVRSTIQAPAQTQMHPVPTLAISPDGGTLAFDSTKPNTTTWQIWLRPLKSPSARPLPGTDEVNFVEWAPDSQTILYQTRTALKRIEVSGGPAQTVVSESVGAFTVDAGGNVIFQRISDGRLARVPLTGGEPQEFLSLEGGETAQLWPYFLPDGKHILYLSMHKDASQNAIYVASVDGKQRKLVLRTDSRAEYSSGFLLFLREGALVAQPFNLRNLSLEGSAVPIAENIATNPVTRKASFSVAHDGTVVAYSGSFGGEWQLAAVDRSGKQVALLGQGQQFMNPAFAPDGKRIAVAAGEPGAPINDLWVEEVGSGSRNRLTFDSAKNYHPVWSPDGTQVAYESQRNDIYGIYVKAANGTGPEERLLQSEKSTSVRDWSPDGRYIVFVQNDSLTTNMRHLYELPVSGDHTPSPVAPEVSGTVGNARLSPDGHWLAFDLNEAGKQQVYVAPFPQGTGRWQISSESGSQPRWARGGRELVFRSGQAMMAASIQPNGSSLIVGQPQELFKSRELPFSSYDVRKDGNQFVFITGGDESSLWPISLITNALEELKASDHFRQF